MRDLPDGCVDAVVTDPPYGIGFLYEGGKEEADTPEVYWEWLKPRVEEMERILKPGGFFACFQTQLYFRYFWEWFGEDIHIYVAAKNFVQLRPTPINYAYDPVVMRYKPGADLLRPVKPKRNVDYFVADTASLVSSTNRLERQHPTPKTVPLLEEIIDNFTLPGGVVFDPFMGSGTTALAAKRRGRLWFGCEKSPAYIQIIMDRLNNKSLRVSHNLPLFAGVDT